MVEYLFYVGHTYAVLGERSHSINAYRKAVLTDSTHQESLIKLGRALHLTGE
jgi:cytochrome c-type biogenesis protein CcmH/NrfG